MAQWLIENLFLLVIGFGSLIGVFFLFFAFLSLWCLIRRKETGYRDFMSITWWTESTLWIISTVCTAAALQLPEEFEVGWSLHRFKYSAFLADLDASIILHAVMATVIYIGAWSDHRRNKIK